MGLNRSLEYNVFLGALTLGLRVGSAASRELDSVADPSKQGRTFRVRAGISSLLLRRQTPRCAGTVWVMDGWAHSDRMGAVNIVRWVPHPRTEQDLRSGTGQRALEPAVKPRLQDNMVRWNSRTWNSQDGIDLAVLLNQTTYGAS